MKNVAGSYLDIDGMTFYNNTDYAFDDVSGRNDQRNIFIYNQSRYLKETAAASLSFFNLTLGYNSTIGLINFGQLFVAFPLEINETSAYPQPDFVSLVLTPPTTGSANIIINTSSCTDSIFTKSGFPTTYLAIVGSGNAYTPSYSSCAGNVWTFDVAGFSGYAAGAFPISFNDTSCLKNG